MISSSVIDNVILGVVDTICWEYVVIYDIYCINCYGSIRPNNWCYISHLVMLCDIDDNGPAKPCVILGIAIDNNVITVPPQQDM